MSTDPEPESSRAFANFVLYSVWANRRLLACCSPLTGEQLTRGLQGSHGSLLGTLWHMYDSEYFWRDNLIAGTIPPLARFGEPSPVTGGEPDFDKLQQGWPAVGDSLERWCSGLSGEQWLAELTCELPGGNHLRMIRGEVAMHMVNHSTLHRGQIVSMLRQLGATPVNTDLIGFYLARVPAVG